MNDWKSLLRTDPTQWLLESENPSVRYFALRDILVLPEEDDAVLESRREIMLRGPVPRILERMREQGYLQTFPKYYTDKYDGLSWQLIVLAELGAQATDQIREQCEYILDHAQERDDGGFSQHGSARGTGGLKSEVIPCLTGNVLWCLIHFGYLDDPRVQKGIRYLTTFLRFNDGTEDDPQLPPYDHYEMCWGRHTCHMGVVKALKALSAVPAQNRTGEMESTVRKATEFMLIHHIYRRSHNLSRTSKPGWLRFGFPLMYQTDALEILDLLTQLGIQDPRMDEAVALVRGKQDEEGRWKLENTYCSDRLLIPMGRKNEPDKWITLRALRTLKRFYHDG